MKIRELLKVFPERVGLGSFLTRSSLKFTKKGLTRLTDLFSTTFLAT